MELTLHKQLINQLNALPTKNYYHIENIDKTDLSLFKFAYFEKYHNDVLTINPNEEIPVPSNWQMYGYDNHQYTNHRYPFPLNPPYIDKDNPCGVYVCNYSVTSLEKNHYINSIFTAVKSRFHIAAALSWCNKFLFTKNKKLTQIQ